MLTYVKALRLHYRRKSADRRDLERLHAHLDEHPDDWDTRRVLADALEEAGDPTHETHRIQVRGGLHPLNHMDQNHPGWYWSNNPGESPTPHQSAPAHLPDDVFRHLAGGREHAGTRQYPSRQHAEQDLHYALRAQRAGKQPRGAVGEPGAGPPPRNLRPAPAGTFG